MSDGLDKRPNRSLPIPQSTPVFSNTNPQNYTLDFQYNPPLQQPPQPPQLQQRSELVERIAERIVVPPLAHQTPNPAALQPKQQRRTRRKSKFTKEQDDMIVNLKNSGKNWVEIAEITGVGNYLTARNRYQVLIGQQGGTTTDYSTQDMVALQGLLDLGESQKWEYLTKELNKKTEKKFDEKYIRTVVARMFSANPELFGVTDDYYRELIRLEQQQPSQQQQLQAKRPNRSQHVPPPQPQPQLSQMAQMPAQLSAHAPAPPPQLQQLAHHPPQHIAPLGMNHIQMPQMNQMGLQMGQLQLQQQQSLGPDEQQQQQGPVQIRKFYELEERFVYPAPRYQPWQQFERSKDHNHPNPYHP